jgi:hypothetical protein
MMAEVARPLARPSPCNRRDGGCGGSARFCHPLSSVISDFVFFFRHGMDELQSSRSADAAIDQSVPFVVSQVTLLIFQKLKAVVRSMSVQQILFICISDAMLVLRLFLDPLVSSVGRKVMRLRS